MFLKRSFRQSRSKRKHPHLRVLQNTNVFWGYLANLIKKSIRLFWAIFFDTKKRFFKVQKRTEKRLVLIVALIACIWLTVASVWPTRAASDRSTFNIPKLGTNQISQDFENAISQNIETETLPFEFENPLSVMQISQRFKDGHLAMDFATEYGSSVKPVAPGVVEKAVWDPYGKGKIVIINHGQNFKTLYAHLSQINVKEGEVVDYDKVIGNVGLTGHTTGSHLHLEVLDNNELVNPVNFLEDKLPDLQRP